MTLIVDDEEDINTRNAQIAVLLSVGLLGLSKKLSMPITDLMGVITQELKTIEKEK
jgi:hypothetical protein